MPRRGRRAGGSGTLFTNLDRARWMAGRVRRASESAFSRENGAVLSVMKPPTLQTTGRIAKRVSPDAGAQGGRPELAPGQPLLREQDANAFLQGRNYRAYKMLGAHLRTVAGEAGVHFAVWAPNAKLVQVIGDFNAWSKDGQAINLKSHSGIWHGFVPGVKEGALYKYHVISNWQNHASDKADPFALYGEAPPRTASVVWDLKYSWGDRDWLRKRSLRNSAESPISIYEMHLGSWRRVPEEGNRS